MARLRIFVSSTYYDLKHIRTNLELFINSMGYESVLYESGDILFSSDLTLDESCYREIENSHMQILIIGGRYGSETSTDTTKGNKGNMYDRYNSVTKIEFQTALDKGLPVYIFVESQVLAEYNTFKKNRANTSIVYAHVDNVSIFYLLDEIYNMQTGNFIKGFDKFEDISVWLKDQWSALLSDYIRNSRSKIELQTLSSRIEELNGVTRTLKEYTEAIMTKIEPENYRRIIQEEDIKNSIQKEILFLRESLIEYLLKVSFDTSLQQTIYEKFQKTENLKDFLSQLNIIDDIKESMINTPTSKLINDYNDLRLKYKSNISSPLLDIDFK